MSTSVKIKDIDGLAACLAVTPYSERNQCRQQIVIDPSQGLVMATQGVALVVCKECFKPFKGKPFKIVLRGNFTKAHQDSECDLIIIGGSGRFNFKDRKDIEFNIDYIGLPNWCHIMDSKKGVKSECVMFDPVQLARVSSALHRHNMYESCEIQSGEVGDPLRVKFINHLNVEMVLMPIRK